MNNGGSYSEFLCTGQTKSIKEQRQFVPPHPIPFNTTGEPGQKLDPWATVFKN
jgi:hypothetical protein